MQLTCVVQHTRVSSFSALTLLVGSFDPEKPIPDMTYNVFAGTLNLALSITPVWFSTPVWLSTPLWFSSSVCVWFSTPVSLPSVL